MTPPIELAHRLLKEAPYVSMPLEEMSHLVDLAYQWAHGVIAA